jgi:hypothetical protein
VGRLRVYVRVRQAWRVLSRVSSPCISAPAMEIGNTSRSCPYTHSELVTRFCISREVSFLFFSFQLSLKIPPIDTPYITKISHLHLNPPPIQPINIPDDHVSILSQEHVPRQYYICTYVQSTCTIEHISCIMYKSCTKSNPVNAIR